MKPLFHKGIWTGVLGALSLVAPAQVTPPQELTLADAVSFAMMHSPALQGAQAEIRMAKAETGIARSKNGPQVGLSGFTAQGSMPNVLQGAMGFEPQALVLAPRGSFTDLNLMLVVPLWTGGALPALVSAALAREQAARHEASGMAAEVALMVRTDYSQALLGGSLVEAAQARLEAAKGMVENAKAMLEAGKGIEANVRRAEAELAEAHQDLTMVENDRQKMVLDLLAEMGASMETSPSLGDSLRFQSEGRSLESALKTAREKRGELLAAKQRARAAKADWESKSGAFLPQVYGFAMGDAFNPRDEMRNRSGYTTGVVASFPLFDSGMRRSEVSSARAAYDRAKADEFAWTLRTEKEVRKAYLDVESAAKNYATATAALEAAQAAYDVVKVRVEAGKGILVEQLDALATLTRARANVAKAVYEHVVAKARLTRAIGETGVGR